MSSLVVHRRGRRANAIRAYSLVKQITSGGEGGSYSVRNGSACGITPTLLIWTSKLDASYRLYDCVVRLPFNEKKATETAAYLLRRHDGRMAYIKLIKLLYLADREGLLRWGRPITTDRYVSMPKGPVVSQIYDLITAEPEPGVESYWRSHIETVPGWSVQILRQPPCEELSRAEEALLDEIDAVHGAKDRWQLVRETHDLPEWVDPCGSSLPIEYRDILAAGKKTEAEIAEIESELENLALIDRLTLAS